MSTTTFSQPWGTLTYTKHFVQRACLRGCRVLDQVDALAERVWRSGHRGQVISYVDGWRLVCYSDDEGVRFVTVV